LFNGRLDNNGAMAKIQKWWTKEWLFPKLKSNKQSVSILDDLCDFSSKKT